MHQLLPNEMEMEHISNPNIFSQPDYSLTQIQNAEFKHIDSSIYKQ